MRESVTRNRLVYDQKRKKERDYLTSSLFEVNSDRCNVIF